MKKTNLLHVLGSGISIHIHAGHPTGMGELVRKKKGKNFKASSLMQSLGESSLGETLSHDPFKKKVR